MKSKLHPTYHQATVTCACGNTFTTGSTVQDLRVDICSKCHPFFTGEQRFIDTLGRVDKFMAKRAGATVVAKGKTGKKLTATKPEKVLSLREMLTVTKTDRAEQGPASRDHTNAAK
ncbi:50S ribosomal protein L31 [Candidatus Collierbacteria bacterium]|nr:50S ribosomal protein L31 [Candidatus Collierbacteria bacterium]